MRGVRNAAYGAGPLPRLHGAPRTVPINSLQVRGGAVARSLACRDTGELKERERKGILRRRPRGTGPFEYRVRLPGPADAEAVDATFEEGIPTVRIPKPEYARSRRVELTPGPL
jgi:Hsp20/alpha crystallin family protein